MNKAKAIEIMENILNPYFEVSEVEVRKAMRMGIDALNGNNPLTCKDVARILTDCANKRCDYCKFKGKAECKNLMVQEMGKKIKRISERMDDDGR